MTSDHSNLPTLSADELQRTVPHTDGNLSQVLTLEPKQAETVDPGSVLEHDLAAAVTATIGPLYSHQATALDLLAADHNVSVTTSTDSGKSFVYALEIARSHRENPEATALLVYPTKALTRDQQTELRDFFTEIGVDIDVRVYDGDTPPERRKRIRDTADIIMTNFAGVNTYLAHHPEWYSFYSNCELVVIDEAHTYTGVHGMHVAWTIRRLRRVLAAYDSDPQFVTTSATIGNPAEHSKQLTGCEFQVVDDDGSPRGQREIAFWKLPFEDSRTGSERGPESVEQGDPNAVREAATLLAHLGLNDSQSLVFTRSRKNTERGAKYASQAADRHPNAGRLEVEPYHAALGKTTRRETEYRFKTGRLDGVTSTNALELGIDIGSIDATILTGYPGTRQSFWQQVGRSGRETRDALSVFIARQDALDQFILGHPEYLLEKPLEEAVIRLENNPVYAEHVKCAAQEHPLTDADRKWFDGQRLDRAVGMWRDAGEFAGELSRSVRYTGSPRPQADISMYGTGDSQFEVRCDDCEIDMAPLDKERAYRDHHEGALFLNDGVQYEVLEFNEAVPKPHITVREVETNEYTHTLSEKTVRDVEPEASRELGDGYRLSWGTGTVEIQYTHYRRVSLGTEDSEASLHQTGLDPIELHTDLVWVETPPSLQNEVLSRFRDTQTESETENLLMDVFGGGLHGAEHGMIKLAPLELRMDKSDLGGLSTPRHPETGVPTWFIHDAVDGGLGFSKRIYERAETIAHRTKDRVAACDCTGTNGCPACIMDAQCGNQNRHLHTGATVMVLDRLLQRFGKAGDEVDH